MSTSWHAERRGGLTLIAHELPELLHVELADMSLERFATVLPPEEMQRLRAVALKARDVFRGRVVWSVNSTSRGGGVAEMLQSLLPYARSAGVDARWVVTQGDDAFFRITKRIHNRLHGAAGDGEPLDDAARAHYEAALAINAQRLGSIVRRGDVVILHDPQTAGLIPLLRELGHLVVWRCHVGVDEPNDIVRSTWAFLRPYVVQAEAVVFSCRSFVWDGLDEARISIVAPSIDPFAHKNFEMAARDVSTVLAASRLELREGERPATYATLDGGSGVIRNHAEVLEAARIEPATPLVVQVSRWDRLKDPLGVLHGFVDGIAPRTDAHLVLAGPAVASVTDDPEGLEVLNEMRTAWHALPAERAARVHLATLPMVDLDENAVIVNALQRRANVVVQKSLAEGFGLTVAEAMWKARPVVASGIGGICDQIEDGVSGVLVDPRDLEQYADSVVTLLDDAPRAESMGRAAQDRVRSHFLGSRHLEQYFSVLSAILPAGG